MPAHGQCTILGRLPRPLEPALRGHDAAMRRPRRRLDCRQQAEAPERAGAQPSRVGARLLRGLREPKQQRPTGIHQRYRKFLDEWDKGFMEAQEEPEGYWLKPVYGSVPKDLHGTLFRNGPGKFQVGAAKIDHPYDGDGFVSSIAFKHGGAYFRSRFVRTAEYEAELRAQRVLFRGTFATQRAGGAAANALDVYVKNTSNTNVVAVGGRLWSLFEAGQPYALDPATLETQGLETLGGRLHPGLPFEMGSTAGNAFFTAVTLVTQQRLGTARHLPSRLFHAGGDAVTAHPHRCSHTGRLCFFSYRVKPVVGTPSLMSTCLRFWELGPDGQPVADAEFSLAGFAFLHDFAVTERYYVLFQNPVSVDNAPYLMGAAPAGSCVRWQGGAPTLVHLVPRPNAPPPPPGAPPLAARSFRAPPTFVFHHANAYESEDGQTIVVDSVHYDSLPAVGREALAQQGLDPDAAFSSRLRRLELGLADGRQRLYTCFRDYLEMVGINDQYQGRRHRYVYGYTSLFGDPQIGIAKVDMERRRASRWLPGFQRFALEPKFVARPGGTAEDDGWLLCMLFDSAHGQSELVVLDAKDPEAGPLCVLRLEAPVPSGLHGCWTPEYYGPSDTPLGGPPEAEAELANVVPFSN